MIIIIDTEHFDMCLSAFKDHIKLIFFLVYNVFSKCHVLSVKKINEAGSGRPSGSQAV